MSLHSGFAGEGVTIMDKFSKDIGNSKSPRVVVPVTHLYLEHIFDLVLKKQWDKSSNAISERSGYNEKLKIIYARDLIDDEHFKTLKIINTIRNEFTHSFNPIDSKIKKLTLGVKGHAYHTQVSWLTRYVSGAMDSISVLCKLLEDQ